MVLTKEAPWVFTKFSVNKHFYYSFQAGLCACGGSVFGKLSNSNLITFDNAIVQSIIFGLCIALMILSNAAVWTFFVKALQKSSSSYIPTISVAATNYILSALAGWLLFGEVVSTMWWLGTLLILGGLALLASEPSKEKAS